MKNNKRINVKGSTIEKSIVKTSTIKKEKSQIKKQAANYMKIKAAC
jgi:hypothetical protein